MRNWTLSCFARMFALVGLVTLGCDLVVAPSWGAEHGPTQAKPTPQESLDILKDGNRRFYTARFQHPHADAERIRLAATHDQGDYAYATVVACSDSRVPVELLFDAGIMDLFVIRVAGNVCDGDEIGSVEYGLAHVHTPVLVILGHTGCGAVTAVTHRLHGDKHKLERNIPGLIDNIVPAVQKAEAAHKELHGDAIIPFAVEQNVWQEIENLFLNSPVSRNLVAEGKAIVVGAVYDLNSGKVKWLPIKEVHHILDSVEHSATKATDPMAP